MGSINSRNDTLFFDFRYQGVRCREYTKLADNPANRKLMQKVLSIIEAAIATGNFDYAKQFPGSAMSERFTAKPMTVSIFPIDTKPATPLFRDFAPTWMTEFKPSWRRSHLATVESTVNGHLIPAFGEKPVGEISKSDILQFRALLAQAKGRNGNTTLAAKTINRVIQLLGQILAEAAERYNFVNPVDKIKRLKQQRVDIHPFTMDQVRKILDATRADYRCYLIVRFFTGMRTGEINGLKWKYIDFERRQILIRETIVRGDAEYTKTDGSQREIEMSQPVYDALLAQKKATGDKDLVFCNREGEAIDTDNFTNRVWYPLLSFLGYEKRRPYQTRHTCATLWLAAGENPEWVARQLGHANTMMLFKTYSRFVPNLTRRDGSAFDRFVTGALHPEVSNAS